MTNYNLNDLTLIKRVTNIDYTETAFNTQLQACLDQAYNTMNMSLDGVTTTPLTGGDITNLIKEIEANIAGGLFKEEKTIPTEGERVKKHILRERGEEMLRDYIATYHKGKTPKKRGSLFRHSKSKVKFNIYAEDEDL